MQLLEFHLCRKINSSLFHSESKRIPTVSSQSTSLVSQKIFHPTQLLWQSRSPDNRLRDFSIDLDLMSIDGLAHIQVNPQTDRNNGGEKNEEAEDIDVPLPSKSIQGNEED